MWGIARAFSGCVLLRIEDHDKTRARAEFEAAIFDDLAWLGFETDFPVVRQREREGRYAEVLHDLERRDLAYPCACSRKDLEIVPGSNEGEKRYPGTCREASVDGEVWKARRVRLDAMPVRFHDLRLGNIDQIPSAQGGDTLIRDRNGNWTYQFAVAVDDFDQGIDLVIRGEDLLESTGRQIQLASLIGRPDPSRFLHHPLIIGADGRKLSKSNRDTGVRELRAAGSSRADVIGVAARALGLGAGEPANFDDIVHRIRAGVGA